ncbi:hypothetical protein DL93DRAFT_660422 [Clavulina sp. PMI_390]|nr:hypothetical protein DL93DRAFT_660422 [Clavulina sp. PMI_390]
MGPIDVYITFSSRGNSDEGTEWGLCVRRESSVRDQPPILFTYTITLVAPGTDRWIEAYQTPAEQGFSRSERLLGALLLTRSELLDEASLEMVDSFIKKSEGSHPDNPSPARIPDWGPELWISARVAQLAMAEWILLPSAAAFDFDYEYHDYKRLRDRIAARRLLLRARSSELGLRGWENVVTLDSD